MRDAGPGCEARRMNSPATVHEPPATAVLRTTKILVGCHVGLSVLTLVAIVLLRNDSTMVNDAVWVRATIVVLSSLLTFRFTVGTVRGSRRAYRRLRLVSAIMLIAIVVILALPGTFPLWLKLEQGVCGGLLLAVALLVNGRALRSSFASGN